MSDMKKQSPAPDAIRAARLAVGLTQTAASEIVSASLRGWQQWEAGHRAMPPGLFELFMIKTGLWSLRNSGASQD
jgi:putative transcriptional regulator